MHPEILTSAAVYNLYIQLIFYSIYTERGFLGGINNLAPNALKVLKTSFNFLCISNNKFDEETLNNSLIRLPFTVEFVSKQILKDQ